MRATLVSRWAVVVLRLAVSAMKLGTTVAGEASGRLQVLTTAAVHASVDAGVAALVIVILARRASPAMRALATVARISANARSTIVAGIRSAVVDFEVADVAVEPLNIIRYFGEVFVVDQNGPCLILS